MPHGGLARGALHEVAGVSVNVEHASADALLVAGILACAGESVLWASERFDLLAPGLAAVDQPPLTGPREILVEHG
ncbi:hypothetical protein CR165_09380 [Pseudoroseomonas aestuarii]|uniref:Uncharacterized protein n=1 Tax=Teichococcus aestuarii TaxID=568898 RepID=A0A2U1V658_9PROT|nr:hypothetical protein CR165_09380 [Pseudoroseomonas aestuarii]